MEANAHQPETGHPIKLTRRRDVINLSYVLSLLARYWWLFVIAVIISIGYAYISLRYDIPQYQASCNMMIKSTEGRTPSGSYIIEGIGLSPEDKSIENQTFMMKSFRTSRRTVDRLDFEIEYYSDGRFKDTELYGQTPFVVNIDSLTPHVLDAPVRLMFNGNLVKVTVITQGNAMYSLKNKKITGSSGAINFETTVALGDTLHSPWGKISIDKMNDLSPDVTYYYLVRSADAIASEYRSRINISTYREGSSIMAISVTGKTPAKLKRFLDEFCQIVSEQNLEQKNEIANNSLMFIQAQLQSLADTLERTQDVLLSFKRNYGFKSPVVASEEVSSQYLDAEKSKRINDLKRDYYLLIKSKLVANPLSSDFMLPAFSDNNDNLLSKLIAQIIDVNNEIALTKTVGNDNNPVLLTLMERNAQLRDELLLSIDKLLENLALRDEIYVREIKLYEQSLSHFPELEKVYMKIDRKYKLNDAIYTFLLQKNSELQISKASNTSNSQVIDQAYVSGAISPNPKKKYQKSLLLGLMFPIAIIALIEYLNVKIRTKEELELIVSDMPLVGIIPHGKSSGSNAIINHPQTALAESFRTIRTRLNFMLKNSKTTIFTITSTNTGDGKTFVSINLASVYALTGKRTVVLGFDLRKPKLNDAFGLKNTKGISNYLIGEVSADEIVFDTGIDNLFVIPSGEVPPNPSELIGSDETATLFDWLKENFDVIIIDSPPVGVVSDARILMQYADAHLFIVRSNYTRKDHLQITLNGLLTDKVAGLGIVFNDLETASHVYGDYYSGYYNGRNDVR